jgi:hypothetical protein
MITAQRLKFSTICLILFLFCLSACAPPAPPAAPEVVEATIALATSNVGTATLEVPSATAVPTWPAGLTRVEAAALASLRKVDDYPLYTMVYTGTIETGGLAGAPAANGLPGQAPWACSLFAALADAEAGLYGRNFDWYYSPALLLFTDPPDGYASVSMVDMAYLGFNQRYLDDLTALPLEKRRSLLQALYLPFDGLNEHGLAVGMAAVPPGNMRLDPDKPTLDNLEIIRAVLDQARTVGEAVRIFEQYNVYMESVPIHYLLADANGEAVLIEYYQGQMSVIPNSEAYHLATNFLVTAAGEETSGQCARYDRVAEKLGESGGRLTKEVALELLSEVSQPSTQWSVVYELHAQQVHVALGREYERVHSFSLADDE